MTDVPKIDSVPALLAHAQAMEQGAMERYRDLAGQMDVHNNADVAGLFRKMAHIESLHLRKVIERASATTLPDIAPWDYGWTEPEAPEAVDVTDVHYLMTPHHALSSALGAERRAFAFYSRLAEATDDEAIRALALELREEEREHVRLMEEWLARTPEPEEGWDDDPDPPTVQE